MVSCLMGDSTALASAIVRCCHRKNLVNKGFCKKKLDTCFDTHCIKTGVQLWVMLTKKIPTENETSGFRRDSSSFL